MSKKLPTLASRPLFVVFCLLLCSTLSALGTVPPNFQPPNNQEGWFDTDIDEFDGFNPANTTNPTDNLLQQYTNILRQNNFFGTWSSLDTTSRPFQNYFQNPSGILLLEALEADMSQGGNYFARRTNNPTTSFFSFLEKTLPLGQSFIGGITTWSLLLKIYDGNYVDQNSANIFYQMMTTSPISFDSNSSTMTVTDGIMSIYLKDGNGDSSFYKQCPTNFSLYFADANDLTQPANINQSPSSTAILLDMTSPDCNITISSGALTIDGFEDTYQINLYMFIASAIGLLQILGTYKVKFQVQNRKTAFKISVGSMWLIATVDYYMLILNLVIVFAYSLKFLLPLLIYMFQTFYLERDIIIKVLQAGRKRGEYDVSDDNCRSCGFHFGLSTLLFVFELIFILMSRLWVIHLTAFVFIPQIIHNAKKSRPYSFNFYHIFMMGLIRIAFVAYLKLYPSNIFKLHPDVNFVVIYSSIMAAQIFILIIQMKTPRLCMLFWDKKKKSRVLDDEDVCPICMCDFKSDASQTQADSALLDLEDTIETPCSHVFHTECLRKWMKNKVECPVCREKVDDILEEVISSEDDGQRQPEDPLILL